MHIEIALLRVDLALRAFNPSQPRVMQVALTVGSGLPAMIQAFRLMIATSGYIVSATEMKIV